MHLDELVLVDPGELAGEALDHDEAVRNLGLAGVVRQGEESMVNVSSWKDVIKLLLSHCKKLRQASLILP